MKTFLITALLAFMLASPVAAGTLDNIPLVMERLRSISGLPWAPPLNRVKEVPLRIIFQLTGKSYARAAYLPGPNYIYYAPGHRNLIPHELVHLLQKAAGLIPSTRNSERHAARLARIYWDRWPN